jgi:hypothetical protein
VLQESALASLEREGWAVAETDPGREFISYAACLGAPVHSRENTPLVTTLRPKKPEFARPGTMSALYGTGAFPLHTDTAHWRRPARYVLLRCIASEGARPTLLLELGRLPSRALAALKESVWVVASAPPFLCSGYLRSRAVKGVRFDRCVMKPRNDAAIAALDFLDGTALCSTIDIEWHPGLLLIVDNWRVLHGRAPARECAASCTRTLQRVLVESDSEVEL